MPDPGMVHRGVVCIRNLFINLESVLRERLKESSNLTGILNRLIVVSKGNAEKPEILQPTTYCQGIEVSVAAVQAELV
jgi:hypothetical protein